MTRFARRPAAALAALLMAPALAAAEGPPVETLHFEVPGPFPLLHKSWQLDAPARVVVTDGRLTPRRVELAAGQTVLWRSVARHSSRIVFEREVARSMVCHSLVNFSLEGDTLVSAPLHTGDEASFCELAPGTYHYRVERRGLAERPSAGGAKLSSRLEGVIVVRPPGVAPVATR